MRKAMYVGAAAILAAFFALAAATVVIAFNAGEGAEASREAAGEIVEAELDGGRPEREVEAVGADRLLREVVGGEAEAPAYEETRAGAVGAREAEAAALESLTSHSLHIVP